MELVLARKDGANLNKEHLLDIMMGSKKKTPYPTNTLVEIQPSITRIADGRTTDLTRVELSYLYDTLIATSFLTENVSFGESGGREATYVSLLLSRPSVADLPCFALRMALKVGKGGPVKPKEYSGWNK